MQEDYPLPASGTIAYQYFEVPTNLTEDRWVQAFEVRPGNRATVHHVIVYTRPPAAPASGRSQRARRRSRPRPQPAITFADGHGHSGRTDGRAAAARRPEAKPLGPNDRPMPKQLGPSIGGYVPGNGYRIYQPGTATKLLAGSTLIFQMHYTTTGKATTDRTKIGLVFAKTPPKTPLVGSGARQRRAAHRGRRRRTRASTPR